MGKNKENKNFIQDKYKIPMIYFVVFIVIYLLLLTVVAPKKHNLSVGDIADVDIKAPVDLVDEAATLEKQQEAASKVDKQYTIKSEVRIDALAKVNTFFENINKAISSNKTDEDTNKLENIEKVKGITLSDEDYNILLTLEKEKLTEIKNFIISSLEAVYEENIEENNYDNIQRARNIVDNLLAEKNYDRNLEEIIKEICYSQIKPNMFYDSEKTEEKIEETKKSIEPEIIKKNQTIIKEGEPVTQEQINLLEQLGMLNDGINRSSIKIFISLAVAVIVILFLQYRYLLKEDSEVLKNKKMLILISSINIILIILSIPLRGVSPYLIPIVCSSMLMAILINSKTSLVMNLLNIILVSIVVGFDVGVILISIVNVIISTMALNKVQQRNDIIYSTIYITVISTLITITSSMLYSNNLREILIKTMYTSIGCFLSGILALGLLPFFESIFDVVTNIKLLELSNPNQPLMKKLLMEAPGTYHHSMMVANIAESATEAVGGNPVIARVGAYYHDIGKTKRPYFFGENQIGRENPHEKITPNLSALIILSHGKDGIELAKEHKIPKVIQDMIVEHHGTTLVKYFYYKAKEAADNPEDIKEEDFRYSGPIPHTKEAGILMLADSAEAAVRSISEPTKAKIEEMVNNIFNDKIKSNQLINCDLTLKDIEIIKKSFLKSFDGMYHQRIEYPTEKKK